MANHDDKNPSKNSGQKIPTAPSTMQRWFPFAIWFSKYNWGNQAPKDLIAAITIAALLIPEAMGCASIAGLPTQVALYATPLALIGYALFGGSKLMVFAVAGSVSAVTLNVVGSLGAGNQEKAAIFAAGLALMGGAVLFAAGVLKLGWIVNFISRSVMMGIIVGMSIQIIIGQIPKLVGIKTPDGSAFEQAIGTIQQFSQWNTTALVLGIFGIVLIVGLERIYPKIPGALLMVVIGSLVVAVAGAGIEVVPKIPSGAPSFSLPTGIKASEWGTLFLGGIVLSLVCFSESWGASSAVTRETHDDIDINQEFRAYGISNAGAAVLGGMPVSGSLSKSSAAMESHSTSQMTNVFLAIIVILVLLVLSPAFQWLPETVLASIVIAAIRHPADPRQFIRFWKIDPFFTAGGILTAIVVLLVGLMPGMIFGVVISIIYAIYRVSFPTGAILGKVPGKEEFAPTSVDLGSKHTGTDYEAREVPGVLVYRFSAPLEFSNAQTFVDRMKALLVDYGAKGKPVKSVVLDCEAIVYTDLTGLKALLQIKEYCEQYDITLFFARMHRITLDLVASDENLKEMTETRSFHTIHEAVKVAEANVKAED